MIRKKAVSLILIAVLTLSILAAIPIAGTGSPDATVHVNHGSIMADELPTPEPTPGSSTDSGVSGGSNGG